MNDYQQLSAQFQAVRNSWKRTAALSGMAIVVSESIGLLTALLFLDWLYKPLPLVRVGMWTLALAGIAWFFVRHVLAPLARKISDEQIALYIEEHRSELDGVLITAAEYGGKKAAPPGQAALIEAVLHEAAARSARTAVAQVVDLSRLKKYAVGAAAGVGLYALAALLFPNAVGHHIGRILNPWKPTVEDLTKRASGQMRTEPIRFTFSKGDSSLARGASFDFEVALSRAADKAVVLNFRPRAQGDKGAWQQLPMTEIEKLNGFKGTLADVSEDLEYYVACGADKSETHKVTVFDPLIVQTLVATTHYPDYVKLADRVENPSSGDVEALAGSKVTMKIIASTSLKEGSIKWSDGRTQSVTIDPNESAAAVVSFDVKEDATYDYTLTDVNGQQAVSAAPLSVHAIPDTPPTIDVKSPQSPVLTTSLGEVNFQVEAGDDFGVEGVDLVYTRMSASGQPKETRVPLTLKPGTDKAVPHDMAAGYRLMLEEANPRLQPNDAISYHLEAHDAKGQKISSPIGFIIIGYFENWAVWIQHKGGVHVQDEINADLMAILSLAWELENQRPQLKEDEVKQRSMEIAGKMIGKDGGLLDFLHADTHPQVARVASVIIPHIKNGHDALVAVDTAKATSELTIAVALLISNGVLEDTKPHLNNSTSMMAGSHMSMPHLTMLEADRLNALAAAAAKNNSKQEDETQSEAAAEAAKKIEELLKNQDALIAKAQKMAAQTQPGDQHRGAAQTPQAQTGNSKAPAPDLAAEQHQIAEKTHAAGSQAKAGGNTPNSKLQKTADKATEAAKKMEEAARLFAAGKGNEALEKATQAKTDLQQAGDTLHNTERDKLEAAISDAERHAALLLEKQRSLRASIESTAKELDGGKKPDQRQGRDLQKQAFQQTELRANAETLNNEIASLGKWAEQAGQSATIRSIADAQKIIKRSQPEVKMANALIDLGNAAPAPAVEEQKKAEDGLEKIIASLRSGADSLAASREAQLRRAAHAADEAKKGIDLLAKGGEAQGKDQSAPGKDQNAPGKSQGSESGGGKIDRQEAAQKLAYDLNHLATGLDQRQLVPQNEVDLLKQMSLDKAELEKRLAVDPKFLKDVSEVVAGISGKIEAEMEAKTEAKKLFSSQREECPPAYRQFVNKYFEVLSQISRPSAGKP